MEQVATLISKGIPTRLQVPPDLKTLEEMPCETILHQRVGTVHLDVTLRLRAPRFHQEKLFSHGWCGVLQQNGEQEQEGAWRGWGRDTRHVLDL